MTISKYISRWVFRFSSCYAASLAAMAVTHQSLQDKGRMLTNKVKKKQKPLKHNTYILYTSMIPFYAVCSAYSLYTGPGTACALIGCPDAAARKA